MFYAYVYKDPRPTKNLQPVYVGKGQGRRAYQHWEKQVKGNKGFGNFLALLRREGLAPIIEIVKDGLDEAEAFYEEIRLIAVHGRRDLKTGPLFNLTDGGEGMVGAVRTEEWRANISAGLTTPEQRSRNSTAALDRWANPAYREKATAAIREALKDPEVIARREAGKAAFIHTPEFAQTMREASTKVWETPGHTEKMRAAYREGHQKPGVSEKKSETTKKVWEQHGEKMAAGIKAARSTDESKAKTSAQAKAQWADPAYHAMQKANNKELSNRPEVKAAKAAATKAMWADPIRRAKMLASRLKS